MNADKTLLTPLCKRLGATLSRRGMLFVGLGIVIIMSVYLFLNLVISVVMNSINRIVIRGSR